MSADSRLGNYTLFSFRLIRHSTTTKLTFSGSSRRW